MNVSGFIKLENFLLHTWGSLLLQLVEIFYPAGYNFQNFAIAAFLQRTNCV